MKHFTPTLPIRETAKNARAFVRENQDVFWTILKPLLPFIITFEMLNIFIDHWIFPDGSKKLNIGSMMGSYFLGALMISWHRVVIHGPDRYVPMNPFKPKRNELAFIFVPTGLLILYIVIAAIFSVLSAKFGGPVIAVIILAALSIFGLVALFKIAFYLPAKAVDASITIGQSFKMTTGYVWKLLSAGFLSSWRLFVISVIVGGVCGVISGMFF